MTFLVPAAVAVALAAPPKRTLRVPFPASRIFESQRETVCLLVPFLRGATSSRFQMASFEVECQVTREQMRVCITLTEPEWPDRIPDIICGREERDQLRMKPVRAYHPHESIWDGVGLLRSVDIYDAVYRVDHPDAPGVMDEGQCSIRDGLFTFETTNEDVEQECHLVMEDGTERTIPIRLRTRARPVGK